jgi:hypothetical protein
MRALQEVGTPTLLERGEYRTPTKSRKGEQKVFGRNYVCCWLVEIGSEFSVEFNA